MLLEATLDKLAQIVNKAAPNYKPFGAVLSEAARPPALAVLVPPASSSSTSATA